MRIALLTTQWPGVRLGGIGLYTLNCARGLAREGHDVHVFTLPLPHDIRRQLLELRKHITLHEVETPAHPPALATAHMMSGEFRYRMQTAKSLCESLWRHHESHPFDIVETPEYEALGYPLQAFSEIPLITQLHSGSAIARGVAGTNPSAEHSMQESLELQLILGSDGLCAPSQAVIEDTWRTYALPNPGVAVEVVPLPFDPPDLPFHPPSANAPILYIGRLEQLKGAHLLAQAAQVMLKNYPSATLHIAGPDSMTAPDAPSNSRRSMAQWMRGRLGPHLLPRIRFLGELTHSQIAAELQQCAFVVVPSLRESYSYVCCEALAAGRPVIVSDQIGATEVVGDAGLSFTRGDAAALAAAMGRLWEDTTLREGLSRVAWDRARTFLSSQTAIAKRIAFYEKIIMRRHDASNAGIYTRPSLLPAIHAARVHLATSLAAGEPSHLPQLSRLAVLDMKIDTPGMRLATQLATLTLERNRPAAIPFYLYGAGRHTAKLLMEKERWESQGHRVIGLIDDHPRFQEDPHCYGLPVISCAAATEKLTPQDVIVLSTDAFEDQFWTQTAPLRAKGITVLRLY